MLLGRVIGTLVASRKEESLEGLKFLVVRQLGVDGEDIGPALNKRVKALSRAFTTRTLNVETLESAQRDYERWLAGRARSVH